MYKILSIDGGGVMGVLAAQTIKNIDENNDFLKDIDLISGTSTGGIIALSLAYGINPDELVEFYTDKAQNIFANRDFWDSISLDELTRANYSNKELKKALVDIFGKTKLKSLKKRVLISSFDLDKDGISKPKFFDNEDPEDREEFIVDIAMRTSAAPTYFPSYQGYIDGVFVANNPADCAIAFAIKNGQDLNNIKLLSLGTGFKPNNIKNETDSKGRLTDHDWGFYQWATKFVDLFVHSSGITSDYRCKQLLQDRYLRINPLVDSEIQLDSADKVNQLVRIANSQDIDSIMEWIYS